MAETTCDEYMADFYLSELRFSPYMPLFLVGSQIVVANLGSPRQTSITIYTNVIGFLVS